MLLAKISTNKISLEIKADTSLHKIVIHLLRFRYIIIGVKFEFNTSVHSVLLNDEEVI